jgi:hypothetical protein
VADDTALLLDDHLLEVVLAIAPSQHFQEIGVDVEKVAVDEVDPFLDSDVGADQVVELLLLVVLLGHSQVYLQLVLLDPPQQLGPWLRLLIS